ncbi:MAG: aminotransferase class V-fold PLP-dependent enzyme [Acidobacteriota bacterium]
MTRFGRAMLAEWALDPDFTYLNHGTVGATPLRVLKRQQDLRDEIERLPARFILRELTGEQPAPWRTQSRLREAAGAAAAFLGARPGDLVFVPNVTTGINAVLRSVALAPGDEVVISDLAYGAVTLAAAVVAQDRQATLRTVALPDPVRSPDAIVEAFTAALTPRTRLVIVDHITAQTALVMPVAEIAAVCRARGIPVLVDGAHAPGSLAVDIAALGVDYYAANLHKWAHAPRPCGILWAAPDRQQTLRHPIASWGAGKGFLREFEWQATSDPTAYLAAPAGIALLHEWGFEAALRYMHGLAWQAADLLTRRWETTLETPRGMVGALVTVPLPARAGATDDEAARLKLSLLLDDHIEVHLHAWRNRLWARVSAQVYNDRSDVEQLADAVLRKLG